MAELATQQPARAPSQHCETKPISFQTAPDLESMDSFLAKLAQLAAEEGEREDELDVSGILPLPPCFSACGGKAVGSQKWLERPDLLGVETSERLVVAELRSLPALDGRWLEEGLDRL